MAKVGAHEVNHELASSHSDNKAAADAFEMVIAAYYVENGFDALCSWVGQRYHPLIFAAHTVFDRL